MSLSLPQSIVFLRTSESIQYRRLSEQKGGEHPSEARPGSSVIAQKWRTPQWPDAVGGLHSRGDTTTSTSPDTPSSLLLAKQRVSTMCQSRRGCPHKHALRRPVAPTTWSRGLTQVTLESFRRPGVAQQASAVPANAAYRHHSPATQGL